MKTLRGVIRKYMGILEKNILGSANASPNMIFFKDPIYFRITPLSVYITNNVCWIPRHIGIHGNNEADMTAKSSLKNSLYKFQMFLKCHTNYFETL